MEEILIKKKEEEVKENKGMRVTKTANVVGVLRRQIEAYTI